MAKINKRRIINEIYQFEQKWEPDNLKLYSDKNDFEKSYKDIIKNNPRGIYDFVLSYYDEVVKHEDLTNLDTKEKLYAATELLIKIGSLMKPYKSLKCNSRLKKLINSRLKKLSRS